MKVACPNCKEKTEMKSKTVNGKLILHCSLCDFDIKRPIPKLKREEKKPTFKKVEILLKEREEKEENGEIASVSVGETKDGSNPMGLGYRSGPITMQQLMAVGIPESVIMGGRR